MCCEKIGLDFCCPTEHKHPKKLVKSKLIHKAESSIRSTIFVTVSSPADQVLYARLYTKCDDVKITIVQKIKITFSTVLCNGPLYY